MKPTTLLLMAAFLAAGCTKAAPTSPTMVDTSNITDSVKLDGKASVQKVNLYFYDDDPFFNATTHIVGLQVTVTDASSSTVLGRGQTGNQGNVSFWIPASYNSIAVTNGKTGLDGKIQDCYVSTTHILNLPLNAKEGWVHIFESGDTYPNCK